MNRFLFSLVSFLFLFSCQFTPVDKLIHQAISEETLPGGVLVVIKKSQVLYKKAYGTKDGLTHNSVNTLYDLASLTKVVTALSVMILKEEGKLELSDKLSRFYPELKGSKSLITIEELLRHHSGYPATISVIKDESYDAFISRALRLSLEYERREKTVYSDVGFIILGDIIHKVSKMTLGDFASLKIFNPLQMNKTSYHVKDELKKECAPTGVPLCLPHDPKALSLYPHTLGHAGVFSTIDDFEKISQMFLLKGRLGGVRILSESSIFEMTQIKGEEVRGLGLDLLSPYARAPRGEVFPSGVSYGHTGFTGTTLWIDPKSESSYLFLSNRVFLGQDKTGKPFTEFRFKLSSLIGKIIYQ